MRILACLLFLAVTAVNAQTGAGKVFVQQLTSLEREFVPLAEAMPAEKFAFAPTGGEFKGVRTFGQQVSHTAAVLYAVAASIVNQKNPSELGTNENGPALDGKDAVVKYLKDAFAYTHKAMASITDQNVMEMVPSPFGRRQVARLSMANVALWHSFDHYGQMVVYARMNGIVPPASRPR